MTGMDVARLREARDALERLSDQAFYTAGDHAGRDLVRDDRETIVRLLDALADREARLAAVKAVLADEPPLLRQIRADLGEGFPNELSERRGRTITGWVDRLRAAALHPDPSETAQGGGER